MTLQIKGEYEVTFLIQNMFNSYALTTRNSNIVTNDGLNLILQILGGKTTRGFGAVHVGKNSTNPSEYDNYSTFTDPTPLTPYEIDVDGNALTYVIRADGGDIDETCEIGILSDDEFYRNRTVITRDVHDTYDIPTNAIVTIKYSLTLSNKAETIEEEEENSND